MRLAIVGGLAVAVAACRGEGRPALPRALPPGIYEPREEGPIEVDALRLLAVFLAHWDNKAPNQRLVCLDSAADGAGCPAPFAVVQDLGATFGPLKVDLPQWKATPVWADPSGCRVSMKDLPSGGGTFPDAVISEGGRGLLAGLLGRLSRRQVQDLFAGARFAQSPVPLHPPHPVKEWADAFEAKVKEIQSRRCDERGGTAPGARAGPG